MLPFTLLLAQLVNPVPIDVSSLATKSDVAAVAAAIPTPMLVAPPLETVGGAAGSAGTYRTGTAVQPRITRTASCAVTISGGIGSCAAFWDTSSFPAGTTIRLAGAPAVVDASVGAALDQPITCKAYGLSVTGISFRCWQAQSSLVTVLGSTVLPFTPPASSVTVQVTAIPAS